MKTNKLKSIRFNIIAIILIVAFCAAIAPVTLQNDTFYSIKIGEYILENGITMQDPFSWHENLEYTFPHWLYDVCIYLIYNIGGMTGVYISTIAFTAFLGIVLYYINVKLNKNKIISFILTIATIYLMKQFVCARAQLVTFILFLLTIYFIEKFLETKKIQYAIGLIIIPILIANLHLATFYFYFILYLPYIAEYAVYILSYCNVIISKSVIESIKKKIKKVGETEDLKAKLAKEEKRYNRLKDAQDKKMAEPYKIKINYHENMKYLLIIFIICIFTGLLTPLGTTPYTYLIKTMQGISTKNISEHLPVVLANDTSLLLTLGCYIAILMLTRVKVRACDIFMLVGLMLLSIFSIRQESMLFIICVIILNRLIVQLINDFNPEAINRLEYYSTRIYSIVIISVIVMSIAFIQYKPKIDDNYIDEKTYPVQAAEWIKENLDINNIKLYNQYNFGSYLLYKDIPVFIDSRCDLYMPEFNENTYVFKDFLNISNANITNMEDKLEEYGFTHFIVPNGVRIKAYLEDNASKYKKIYPVGDIIDENFTIYEKIKE